MFDKYRLKLKLVFVESILAVGAFGIMMPIMTEFWKSIGMNQTFIGLTQMICTIVIVLLDIPMGYIADRYNRKMLNVIGDFGLAASFIIYMFAKNFWWAIVAEIMCGVFVAMTNGVDRAFLKFYSDSIDESGELFKKNNAKLQISHNISLIVCIGIGMIISKYSLKACLGASAIPFIMCGLCSIFIDDIGTKAVSEHKSNTKAMLYSVKEILKEKKLRWLIMACSVSGQVTHAIIWILTPMLIKVGVPVYIVGLAWIINHIMPILGSMVAKKCTKFKLENKFLLPYILICINCLIVIMLPNIYTVWLLALNSFASSFCGILLMPIVQEETQDCYQTTVVSLVSTCSRLLYIPLVYLVNMAADSKLEYGLLVNLLIFAPFYGVIYFKLKKKKG